MPYANGSSLSYRASILQDQWEAALAQSDSRPAALSPDAVSLQIAESGRASAVRIARAMVQEGLLRTSLRRRGEAEVRIPRPDGEDGLLVLRGLSQDDPTLYPDLELFQQELNGALVPLENPVALLDFVAPALQGALPQEMLRLADELTDGLLNDALCRSYRSAWNTRLRKSIHDARQSTFWDWLKDRPDQAGRSLMLEQWSAVGHPYHPIHKTRLGMSPVESLSFCPEFEPQVQIGLVAVRSERAARETMPGTPAAERWLDHYFPTQAAAWREGLAERGSNPDDYVPIPVHPWQAKHAIPLRFGRSIAKGELLLAESVTIPAAPMVSVRTVVPMAMSDAPHLKLSLGVRLGSVERTISPRSCEMGPRISKLLQGLIERDAVLSSCLAIQPEEAGLFYASADPDEKAEAHQLAALLRRNPTGLCNSDEVLIPTTALMLASPMSGAPLLLELSGVPSDAGLAAFRRLVANYAEALLRPLLTLYLRYGICLEAHQQNTLALYSRGGQLRRFLFRDFGGIRIHEPTLREAGLDLKVHPDRLTVVDDRRALRRSLYSRALHYHIGHLISRVCHHQRSSEQPFWTDIADVIQTILDGMQGEVAAQTWRRERAALLDDDWDYKASLRMRMEDLSHEVFVQGRNPLRR